MTLSLMLASRKRHQTLAANRRGVVSLIFASAVVVLLMLIGLSINYSFYNDAQTELNMAADAASIHAADTPPMPRPAAVANANMPMVLGPGLKCFMAINSIKGA